MNTLDEVRETYQRSSQRFADYFLTFAENNILEFVALDGELANLFAALLTYSQGGAWVDSAHLIQALGSYLDTRGYWSQHRVWLERVSTSWDGTDDPATQIEILDSLADITNSQGERDRSKELYQKVIRLAEANQDEFHLARAYHGLGTVYFNLNQNKDTRVCWEKALSIAQRIGDESQVAVIRYFLGSLDLSETNNESAHGLMNQAIRIAAGIAPQLGDLGKHLLIQLRAMTHFARGEDDEARQLYLDALELAKKEGDQMGIALTLYQLGYIAHHGGDLTSALDYYQQSRRIAEPMNDRTGLIALYPMIGLLYMQRQRFDLARPYLEQAVAFKRQTGDPSELADALYWLGYALANTNSSEQAKLVFEESLGIFTMLHSPRAQDIQDVLSRLEEILRRENDNTNR